MVREVLVKTIAFIPARYDSTRFPGKPLALIAGTPMIQHVYERAMRCPEVSEVYVATDDERIRSCVNGFGGKAVMTDPGHRSGTDRICEAALSVGVAPDDIVVNIQGDQPTFPPEIIGLMVAPFHEDPSVVMTTLKYGIVDEEEIDNPNHVKVVTDNLGRALYFSRFPVPFVRDAAPDAVRYKHLGFYGYRMEFLTRFTRLPEGVLESLEKLEQLRALEHGFRITVVETEYDSAEVDVPEDVARVESILARPS